MVELTIPYFSHSFLCKVSNIKCLPMQHLRILSQLVLATFLLCIKSSPNCQKELSYILMGEHKLGVFENYCETQK